LRKYERFLDEEIQKKIKNHIDSFEDSFLRSQASKSKDATRRKERKVKDEKDIRTPYCRDADRILHSHAYSRYIDKTQVFFLVDNDHITHRVLHVNFVSKIARTIGKALKLNEDLIDAIAIGHDIGHPPFGHLGENKLNKIFEEKGVKDKTGRFIHNVQAIQFLDKIENKNLTLEVLDGILCHNGEDEKRKLKPNFGKSWNDFSSEIEEIKNGKEDYKPMTFEGCIVRFADIIAYIARDIKDAKEIDLISDDIELPKKVENRLGSDYGNIINSLIIDLIENSLDKDYISYSEKTFEALKKLKKFNYDKIYNSDELLRDEEKIEGIFKELFDKFLKDLKEKNKESTIFKHLLDFDWVNDQYEKNHTNEEIVRDYIAGMTDRYFIEIYKDKILPTKVETSFEEDKYETV